MHRIALGIAGAAEAVARAADVVIVDALRASSTICALFQAKAKEIIVCSGVKQARKISSCFDSPVLVGEYNSIKPDDFFLGNSPVAALAEDLSGKTVIFTSSNGARLLVACRGAGRVMVGSLNNIESVGREVNTGGARETLIIAAGDMEAESDEDLVSAALIAEASGPEIDENQEMFQNQIISRVAGTGLRELFRNSTHGRELLQLGHSGDVDYCSRADVCPVVPVVEQYLELKGEIVARLRIA